MFNNSSLIITPNILNKYVNFTYPIQQLGILNKTVVIRRINELKKITKSNRTNLLNIKKQNLYTLSKLLEDTSTKIEVANFNQANIISIHDIGGTSAFKCSAVNFNPDFYIVTLSYTSTPCIILMELIKDISAPDEFDIIQSTIHLMKQSSKHHIDLYKLILQLISSDISPELSSAREFIIKYLSQLIQTPTHMRAVDIFKELVTSIKVIIFDQIALQLPPISNTVTVLGSRGIVYSPNSNINDFLPSHFIELQLPNRVIKTNYTIRKC